MTSRVLLALVVLSGCATPCQQLCVRMADYATECGINVADAAIDTCIADQAEADQVACRATGDSDTLRREWDCDDLRVFFR